MKMTDKFKKEYGRWKNRTGLGEWSWRRLIYLSLFFLSSIFVAFMLIKNWSDLSERTSEVDFSLILLAVILYPLGMLPTALSWHMVLNSLGIERPVWFNLRAYSLSSLPRKIPGNIWFLSSRASLYREVEVPTSTSISATLIESLLLALTGIGLSILLASRSLHRLISENRGLAIAIPGFVALFIIILLLFSNLGGELRKLIGAKFRLVFPQIQLEGLFGVIGVMSIAWIGGGVLLFITIHAVEPIPLENFFNIVGIWALSGSISLVISLGFAAFGIREITLAALLSTLISPVSSIIVAIAFRIILTLGELIWTLIIITIANWRINALEKR